MGLDSALIQTALETARQNGFSEVEILDAEDRFHAKFNPGSRSVRREKSATKAPKPAPPAIEVRAQLVGYFREIPQGLKPGMTIAEGEIIGMISALGIENEVESPVSGEVLDVRVKAGQSLQYGQIIAVVQTA